MHTPRIFPWTKGFDVCFSALFFNGFPGAFPASEIPGKGSFVHLFGGAGFCKPFCGCGKPEVSPVQYIYGEVVGHCMSFGYDFYGKGDNFIF